MRPNTLFSSISFVSLTSISALILVVILNGCSDSEEEKSMSNVLGNTTVSYSEVNPETQLVFPSDHLSHPSFRQEWWYLTANLRTKAGKRIGIQWTQFRMAMSAEIEEPEQTEGWATHQLYLAHTAVTTEDVHLANEKWSRAHPKFAAVTANPLTIKLDNWKWQAEGNDLFPALLTVESDRFNYQLSLTSNSPLQLQGENGFSRKSADGRVASHYYSQPFIEVEGEIELEGELIPVTGTAWLDREWSSQFLTGSQQGWDWFALRLNDGSTLMLFQLRESSHDQPGFYSARRMYPDGRGENVASSELSIEPLEFHQIDEGRYPVAWNIIIPSQQIDLNVKALNIDAKMPLSIPYWEGPVLFSGSHSGEGYMELTGY